MQFNKDRYSLLVIKYMLTDGECFSIAHFILSGTFIASLRKFILSYSSANVLQDS